MKPSKHIFACLLGAVVALSTMTSQAKEPALKDLFRYQDYWPEEVELTRDVKVPASGDKEAYTLEAGEFLEVAGVSNRGLKAMHSERTVYLKISDTDIIDAIQLNAEADGIVVKFLGKSIPKKVAEKHAPESGGSMEHGEGLASLFPEKLIDKDGNDVPREQIEGKFIGVYFSAHW